MCMPCVVALRTPVGVSGDHTIVIEAGADRLGFCVLDECVRRNGLLYPIRREQGRSRRLSSAVTTVMRTMSHSRLLGGGSRDAARSSACFGFARGLDVGRR